MSTAVVDEQGRSPSVAEAANSAVAAEAAVALATAEPPSAAPAAAAPAPAQVVAVSAEPVGLVLSCPHCRCRFRRDKPLERRASGRCPSCNRKIWIDPFQQLFSRRICLTNEEATHVDFVMRLGDLPCGQPIVLRLRELRHSLAADATETPSAKTIVKAAFDLAAEQCVDADEEQCLRELRRGYRSFLRRRTPANDEVDSSGPSSQIGSLVDDARRHATVAAAKLRSFLVAARQGARVTAARARTFYEQTGRRGARAAEVTRALVADPRVQASFRAVRRLASFAIERAGTHVAEAIANARLIWGLTVVRSRVLVATLL